MLGDAHVRPTFGRRAQRRRAHAVRRGLGLVARRLVEGDAEVGVLGELRGLAMPRLVQDADVGRVDRALDALEPVARHARHRHPRVRRRLVGERQVGKGGASPPPSHTHASPPASCTGKCGDRQRRPRTARPHELGRRLDHAAGHVDLPAVVDAAHAVALDARRARARRGGAGRARRGSRCGRPRRGTRRSSRRGGAPASGRRRARGARRARTAASSSRA